MAGVAADEGYRAACCHEVWHQANLQEAEPGLELGPALHQLLVQTVTCQEGGEITI